MLIPGVAAVRRTETSFHTYQNVQVHLTTVYKYSTVTRLTSNDMTLTAFILQSSHFHWFLFTPSRAFSLDHHFRPNGIWEFHFFPKGAFQKLDKAETVPALTIGDIYGF